jgi:glycolate oxidase FAD binding subunit
MTDRADLSVRPDNMTSQLSIPEIQDNVRSHPRVAARGGGSKTALQPCTDGVTLLDMTGLHGLIEYQPEEFTFMAWAGSRVADIQQSLAAQGHFLPFDPVLVERGATWWHGCLQVSRSAIRYGGLRDFLLGVKFVDGLGTRD